MPEEAASSSYSVSIVSLLSQRKLTGKLRHREIKDFYKADKRQDNSGPFGGLISEATRPHGLTKEMGNYSLHQSPQCQAITHLGADTAISHDRNEKTEPRESQR